ncbi:MAG: hypothetical protein LBQ47_07535, partial [Endomicrobium sp.]|nr:hypothetical protein [Endomicrobium sp.]
MNKLISVFTALCFAVSIIGADIAHAAAGVNSAKVFDNSVSFIPFNLGRVVESKTFEDSRYTVINIQDLHCHIETQKNIERIIDALQKTYNISAIFVEGGYDEIDTGVFESVKDEKLKNNIIEGLFEKGRLTGAEYYYLKNDIKTPFYGLEDRDIHEQNLERLSKALNNNQKYNEKLSQIKAEIEYLKAKYFSRENHRFSATFEKYKSGAMPMERYYAVLRKYIEKLNRSGDKYNSLLSISSGKYPLFIAFCSLMQAKKKIEYNKAAFEIGSLVNYFKANLSYSQYNKLSLETAGFSDIEELGLRLPELSKQYGININAQSNLAKLINYIQASKKINLVEMLDEERRIAEDIRIAFSSTAEEIEISFLSDFYIYLESFLNTKITAGDYEFFEKEYPRFEKIYSKYAFKNALTDIKEDIAFLTKYYAVNKDRNSIFIKNIEKRLDKNSSDNIIIAVTGGFHSRGINKLFSENGTSYINVMPQITQETKSAEENYNSFLELNSVFSSQTLALSLALQARKPEIARLMIDIAAGELSDVAYDKKNIDLIIESIEEALGEKIEREFLSGKTTVELPGGFELILRNNNGKITSETPADLKTIKTDTQNFSQSLEAAKNLSSWLGAGFGIFNPRVSDTVKNIAAIAAKYNLITGDGLIFDIESNEALAEVIDGLDKNIIRKLPETLQSAILKAHQRDELINSQERIFARIFLAGYCALGLDKSALDAFFRQEYLASDIKSVFEEKINAGAVEEFDLELSQYYNKMPSIADSAARGKILAVTFKRFNTEGVQEYYARLEESIFHFSDNFVKSFFDKQLSSRERNKLIRALNEMLKNAFVHGNNLDGSLKTYVYADGGDKAITVINVKQKEKLPDDDENMILAAKANLHGKHLGIREMSEIGSYADFDMQLANGENIRAANFKTNDKPIFLELKSSSLIADMLGLKGSGLLTKILRGTLVGVIEMLPSALLPVDVFVNMHVNNSYEEFVIRREGAVKIKRAAWIAFAAGLAGALLIGASAYWAILPAAFFNVLAHVSRNFTAVDAKISRPATSIITDTLKRTFFVIAFLVIAAISSFAFPDSAAYKTLIPQYIQPIEYVQPLNDSVLSGRTFETGGAADQTKITLSIKSIASRLWERLDISERQKVRISKEKVQEAVEFSNGEFAQKYVNEIYDLIEKSGVIISQRRPILFIGNDVIDFKGAIGSFFPPDDILGLLSKASFIMVDRAIFEETDEKIIKSLLFMVILHENIHAENYIYLQENKTYMTNMEDEYLACYVTQQAFKRVMPESREMIWQGLCAQTFKAMMDNAEIFIQTLNSVKKNLLDPYKFGYKLGYFQYTDIHKLEDSIMSISMETHRGYE